jgi:uncharacterized membrane protein YciS (DUF1049 family)
MMKLLKLVLTLALMLLVVLFVVSNREVVMLRLWPLPGTFDQELGLVGVALAGIGFVLGALVVWLSLLPKRMRASSDRRIVEAHARQAAEVMGSTNLPSLR